MRGVGASRKEKEIGKECGDGGWGPEKERREQRLEINGMRSKE
jgi:hypothetical protein